MKAVVVGHYGPPEAARIAEVPVPVPKPGEVLVRVSAAGVTAGDARIRGLDVPAGFATLMRLVLGWNGPRRRILGADFSGKVEGKGSPEFPAGTRLFGARGLKLGAHAEYLAVGPKDNVLPCPDGMTDAGAAGFFFGGLTAADFLIDKARLQAGESLLINGATGAVGAAAIQIARHLGARITAVASGPNLDFARELGADVVHDYRSGPLTGIFDVVMDVAGTLPWASARPLLAESGRLLVVTGTLAQTIGAALRARRGNQRVYAGVIAENRAAMQRLIGLWTAGAYRPVITAALPMEQIVQAYRLADGQHKRGNVVIVMAEG